ncbi:MAG: Fe-S cluster assembly sulfur transfer protein SufU [Pseudomonadota bacterium]
MSNALILYQGDILKFGRNPNNYGEINHPTIMLRGDSPICGDHLTLYLSVQDNTLTDVKFSTEACCAVCKAASSMMTDAIKGKSLAYVERLASVFLKSLQGETPFLIEKTLLGDLTLFLKLREIPSRIDCAALSWTTLTRALDELKKSSQDYSNQASAI